jgi:hypothetical protein
VIPKLLRFAAAGLTVALLSLVLAAGAGAAPRQFYGVVSAGGDPTDAELAHIGRGKVGMLRVSLAWGAVESAPGAPYNWNEYDALIGGAARNGIRVLPTVYSSPIWLNGSTETPPLGPDLGKFQLFVLAAAQRYGANGTFWTENPDIPKLPFTYWQLWNEPNSPSFWKPKPNPKQYVKLLRGFESALKLGDPAARIVLAGLFMTPRIKNGIFLDRYLPALYRNGARGLFDAVAMHPYSTTPRQALDAIRDVRRLMARFKDRRKQLWITEVGWASAGQRTPLTVGRRRQARYLRQIFKLTAANRGRFKIGSVFWYSLQDLSGKLWLNHTGLFTRGFSAKPAWKALVRLTGGSP